MSVRKILIGLGIFVALLPYMGLPSEFDAVLSTLAGFAIVLFLLARKSTKPMVTPEIPTVQPIVEKELRVKRGASKNAANIRMEKPTEREVNKATALPQEAETVVGARVTTQNGNVSPAKVETPRVVRSNKS